MEIYWDALPVSDKGFFKSEMLDFRQKNEATRQQYFDLEKHIESEIRALENDPVVRFQIYNP